MTSKLRSDIWYHFVKLDGKAKCGYCEGTLAMSSGSTGNLKRHLKTRHPTVSVGREQQRSRSRSPPADEAPPPNATSQPNPSDGSPASSPASIPDPASLQSPPSAACEPAPPAMRPMQIATKRSIDIQLLKMICREYLPFSIVHEEEFRKFVRLLNGDYNLPSRHALRTSLLPSLYNEMLAKVKAALAAAPAACVTCESWTNIHSITFFSLTAHFLDKATQLTSCFMECSGFSERRASANLSSWMKEVLETFSIRFKICAVVTDDADMAAAAADLRLRRVACFAHSLNAIVKEATSSSPSIRELLGKAKGLAQYFQQSSPAAAKLRQMQTALSKERVKLEQEVPTSWNSTYHMLERLVKTKEPIVAALALLGSKEPIVAALGSKEPIMSAPVSKEPIVALPGCKEPIVALPGSEKPIMSALGSREPIVSALPDSREPIVALPGSREPIVALPGSREPIVSAPVSKEPIMALPGSREPIMALPGSREPIVALPGSREPIVALPGSREPIVALPGSREPIGSTLPGERVMCDAHEWEAMDHSAKLLALFDDVTKEISSETNVSLSETSILSRITTRKVLQYLENNPDLPESVSELGEGLADGLSKRFGDSESNEMTSQCILLDPRFKKQGFGDQAKYRSAYQALAGKVRASVQRQVGESSRRPASQTPSSSVWGEFDASLNHLQAKQDPACEAEMEKYMEEPHLPRTGDPLHWWETRKFTYPNLYSVVVKRLCIPATSVPCERLFSEAGQIGAEKRRRLTGDNVKEILFVNNNSNFFEK